MKQFTHKKWYNERQLFDGEEPFAIVDVYNQADKICDKLNEVAEENKELKQSNKDAWNLIRFIYNEIKEDGSMDWWRIQDLVEFEE